ncbi:hypothetical protein [Jeongeupia sp. USM3]|uniref:hypothetical protein n=1 Tax=Jeongeupia sp. USM3 TaxID=1906741 RepID=UPI00089E046B|nr:hypothetical protein [Jeongeupia sp. USM3]AOX99262.1 hypothetical protein BJP62_01620 [Jeongeupia sp. USM3]
MKILHSVIVVTGVALLYWVFFRLNMLIVAHHSFSTGTDWIFLPSGLRLLFILLFVGEGAIGICIASIFISYAAYFRGDLVTAFGAGLISGFSPLLARFICLQYRKLTIGLEGLTGHSLLEIAGIFAVLSAVFHQLWFYWRGISSDFAQSAVTMIIGDFLGTLLMLYAARLLLGLWGAQKRSR